MKSYNTTYFYYNWHSGTELRQRLRYVEYTTHDTSPQSLSIIPDRSGSDGGPSSNSRTGGTGPGSSGSTSENGGGSGGGLNTRSGSGTATDTPVERLSSTNLYIRGLHAASDDSELYKMCKEYGNIISTKAILDKATNQCKGYGFVDFETAEMAENAIACLNRKGGITAQLAKQQEQDSTNLYLANLPQHWDEPHLIDMLKGFGNVISTRILKDGEPKRSRGVGFARMGSKDVCIQIIDQYHGKCLQDFPGTPLVVKFADAGKKQKRPNVGNGHHGPSALSEYFNNPHNASVDLTNLYSSMSGLQTAFQQSIQAVASQHALGHQFQSVMRQQQYNPLQLQQQTQPLQQHQQQQQPQQPLQHSIPQQQQQQQPTTHPVHQPISQPMLQPYYQHQMSPYTTGAPTSYNIQPSMQHQQQQQQQQHFHHQPIAYQMPFVGPVTLPHQQASAPLLNPVPGASLPYSCIAPTSTEVTTHAINPVPATSNLHHQTTGNSNTGLVASINSLSLSNGQPDTTMYQATYATAATCDNYSSLPYQQPYQQQQMQSQQLTTYPGAPINDSAYSQVSHSVLSQQQSTNGSFLHELQAESVQHLSTADAVQVASQQQQPQLIHQPKQQQYQQQHYSNEAVPQYQAGSGLTTEVAYNVEQSPNDSPQYEFGQKYVEPGRGSISAVAATKLSCNGNVPNGVAGRGKATSATTIASHNNISGSESPTTYDQTEARIGCSKMMPTDVNNNSDNAAGPTMININKSDENNNKSDVVA